MEQGYIAYDNMVALSKGLRTCYNNMKQVCYTEQGRDRTIKCYRDKGIKVCDEWLGSFGSFYDWAVTHGYTIGKKLSRINKDMDFSPDNCEWVSTPDRHGPLSDNLRKYRKLAGMSVADAARETGVAACTVYGWERGLAMPPLIKAYKLAVMYNCKVDDFLAGMPLGGGADDAETEDGKAGV